MTMYNIEIDISDDIIELIYDMLRFSTIQMITHILYCINNPTISFFSYVFFQTFIFINLSLLVYWLIIRKLFSFKSKKDDLKE